MRADEMRRMYVEFFEERGHKKIASASLVPNNDPSVLFTTAGMHPLVPYLLGERHPLGDRLVGVQKCVRTDDIEEVGDGSHHTFFEMLGNWSLGDYFKEKSIKMSYEFLTEYIGIPTERLAVTVFDGYGQIPRDDEACECWKRVGIKDDRIYFYGMEENWWGPVGETGPCGPDSEIFYDTGAEFCGDGCGPACGCGKFVEIWNNVFMQYNKLADGSYILLGQKNVDTGMSLERVLAVYNHMESNYEIDVLAPILNEIENLVVPARSADVTRDYRIITDHMRAAVFILGDRTRTAPSNTRQGYILRRLIRRVIRLIKKHGATTNLMPRIADVVISLNAAEYPELAENHEYIIGQLEKEFVLFGKTLDKGLKAAEKIITNLKCTPRANGAENVRLSDCGADYLDGVMAARPDGDEDMCLSGDAAARLSGADAFKLFDTFGLPLEFTVELAKENGVAVDLDGFNEHLAAHREKSRNGAKKMFKGGLNQ